MNKKDINSMSEAYGKVPKKPYGNLHEEKIKKAQDEQKARQNQKPKEKN